MTTYTPPRHIVIIGAGIIGSTTSFYLSEHPVLAPEVSITVIEASHHGAAQGASGKAGGLVAKWAYPTALARLSFAEHTRLAQSHDGAARWGWRLTGAGEWEGRGHAAGRDGLPAPAGGADAGAGAPAPRAAGLPDDLRWVSTALTDAYEPLAPAGDTAQVHPRLFTRAMLKLAGGRVRLVRGRVTALDVDAGRVRGVRYVDSVDADAEEQQYLAADCVVLAAGAWSPRLLPGLPVYGTRGHSIVVRAPAAGEERTVAPYVLFTNIALPAEGKRRAGRTVTPEIYPRPDATIYVCGPGDTRVPLPETVDGVEVDARACEEIWEWVAETGVVEPWALGDVVARHACYIPSVSVEGGPIVGRVPGIEGFVVATGHQVWGICNAPGTAKAVAELVLEGKIKCADLSELDPAKFLK
ncbi:FAD dependent oxidoreductase [Gloeopeniophorella convolvens]|nr:FAD dependent oxidoreductase [Gloeopeniophorella convolvens]